MKSEDANVIFLLEYCAEICGGYHKDNTCENCEIDAAMNALERQIPKKPKVIGHWRMCPRCYEEYGFDYDILIGMRGLKTGVCRCLNCGQVIELEAEE